MNGAESNGSNWRIGKEIPLALLLGLLLQTVGFVWWLSSLNSAVNTTSVSLVKLEQRVAAIDIQLAAFSATVTTPIAINAQKILSVEGEVRELRLRLDTMRFEQVRGGQQIEDLRSKR